MSELKTYSIPIKTLRFEDTDNPQFLKTKFFAISEGENLNRSSFELEGIQECLNNSDYALKPILGSWDKNKSSEVGFGNFGGHDSDLVNDAMTGETYNTYLGEKNERPLGLILPNTAKIELYKGKQWLTFEGLIWSEYNKEAVRLLKKKRSNNVSVEIRVLDMDINDKGIEIIKSFSLLGITIIGVDAGIPNACVNLMEFAKTTQYNNFVMAFSSQISELNSDVVEVFLKRDQFGSGEALKLDLSKDGASSDNWGAIQKTKLRNDLLKAKNYKSIIPKSYLVVEDGWEESPSDKLKYPIVQIKDNNVVLNENGVKTAGAYLMKEQNEPYFKTARAKLNKVRRILGMDKLMSLEFGVETDDDWGEDVSKTQPEVIKMNEGGNDAKMEKMELISKLSALFEDKSKMEEELTQFNSVYEEKVGEFEYAEDDAKENMKTEMEKAKEDIDNKEMEVQTCESSILETAKELISLAKDDEDADDDKEEPEIDDEEEEEPVDTEGEDKYAKMLGDGKEYICHSKSYVVYEKDGEIYVSKYGCNEDGEFKLADDSEVKCEKAFVRFKVGGVIAKDNEKPVPPVRVEITRGLSKAYARIKDEKQKSEMAKAEKEKYMVNVKSMLTKYEEVTDKEDVDKEFKDEICEKIFSGEFTDANVLEEKVMAHLYKHNSKKNILNGSFARNSTIVSINKTDTEKINDFIKDFK